MHGNGTGWLVLLLLPPFLAHVKHNLRHAEKGFANSNVI